MDNHRVAGKGCFNLAVVCGDGLSVSGLLTTFRNVVDMIQETSGFPQLIQLPIPADLGYSWRPDKAAFFPRGPDLVCYPQWFSVTSATPVQYDGYAEQILRIRHEVAESESLSTNQKEALRRSIDSIAAPYQRHFEDWFEAHDIDWVCAINMTISDAVPVTLALHRAAETRWGKGRPGGVFFWDHDLFQSYAVHDNNQRLYPTAPNEFTPLPQDLPWHVWVVVSDLLAPETKQYPTKARPLVVPNLLPVIPSPTVNLRDRRMIDAFLSRFDILDGVRQGRPVLLCPVRVFPVKGIEISIRVFAAMQKLCRKRNLPFPYLLIFGDPKEDPKYAAELIALAEEAQVSRDIRFLGGVPLCSGTYHGLPWLDEKDLLRIAAMTHGGVLFTPGVAMVESVGLGPALASVAGVPCAVTTFNALQQVYSGGLHCVHVDFGTQDGLDAAAREFLDMLLASAPGKDLEGTRWSKIAHDNKELMLKTFPTRPWKKLIIDLATKAGVSDGVLLEAGRAFGI
jgi:glycosyltransferase involved in cell wall biosynthesis